MALLEIDELKTQFFTSAGTVLAVDGISYTVEEERRGRWRWSASPAAASPCPRCPYCGWWRTPPGKIVGGRIGFMGRNLLELSDSEIRDVRGRHIGMIFQEPMTSLNPVLSIGTQLTRDRHPPSRL